MMNRRKLLTFLTGAMAGVGATLASLPFIRSMNKADHIEPQYLKVKFPKLKPGQMMTVPGRKNTLYVVRRTQDQIKSLSQNHANLLDPLSDISHQPSSAKNHFRSLRSDIFVAWGNCTHHGCTTSKISVADAAAMDYETLKDGGFHCPCHGAAYDSAGRVFKGMPARRNLDIPEYVFLDETTIKLTEPERF